MLAVSQYVKFLLSLFLKNVFELNQIWIFHSRALRTGIGLVVLVLEVMCPVVRNSLRTLSLRILLWTW